jgi:hypothetical protein
MSEIFKNIQVSPPQKQKKKPQLNEVIEAREEIYSILKQ